MSCEETVQGIADLAAERMLVARLRERVKQLESLVYRADTHLAHYQKFGGKESPFIGAAREALTRALEQPPESAK